MSGDDGNDNSDTDISNKELLRRIKVLEKKVQQLSMHSTHSHFWTYLDIHFGQM
jgi:hypothetical protein